MPLDTLIFDPSPCGFPTPRVPLLPRLDLAALWSSFGTRNQQRWAPAGHFRQYSRGRYALREAYHRSGIGTGTTLLAPAYHCRTMLDSALALGGDVVLYPVLPDLSPDVPAIERAVAREPKRFKAVLATHFFGLPQNLNPIADWCRQRDIVFVEDCSHALVLETYRAPDIGRVGDYITSSPYKFLPSFDGGLLYAREAKHLAHTMMGRASLVEEVRGILSIVTKAWRDRSRATTALSVRHGEDGAPEDAASVTKGTEICRQAGPSDDYQVDDEHRASLLASELVIRRAPVDLVARRRRDNYNRWVQALGNAPNCRLLYPRLPEGCVPYMFPLVIDHPDPHFYQLKQLGVPIWRWDSLAVSTCETANRYRTCLLHLPCHQTLSDSQLAWMTGTVAEVLSGGTTGANV